MKIPKKFWNDSLYKALLTARDKTEYEKAKETLLSIRGSQALENLKKAILEENK